MELNTLLHSHYERYSCATVSNNYAEINLMPYNDTASLPELCKRTLLIKPKPNLKSNLAGHVNTLSTPKCFESLH